MVNGNLRDLNTLSPSVRNQVIKCLISLSKYLGVPRQFRQKLRDYGVKLYRSDVFSSFLRMLNGSNSDVLKWYKETIEVLRGNERLLLKFLVLTGLRSSEAITSFNLIVQLVRMDKLHEYYSEELQCLEHFKYRQLFLRKTKNTYISFIPRELISQIADNELVSYNAIRKRLLRSRLKCRLDELRDFFGSFMIRHGLIQQEQDLLCGRIPGSVFIRHYWNPSFKDLRDRTLKAIRQLEQKL
jgi:intergrase/recombinase